MTASDSLSKESSVIRGKYYHLQSSALTCGVVNHICITDNTKEMKSLKMTLIQFASTKSESFLLTKKEKGKVLQRGN